MRILLTADPELPVPPRLYGGIERIVDVLARGLSARDHEVGLVAHGESTCPLDRLYGWPGRRSQRPLDLARNLLALRSAVRDFRPDLLHSFSRVAYLAPLLTAGLPKIMSYQRPPSLRTVKWASRIAGSSLRFTGCSNHICNLGAGHGNWTCVYNAIDPSIYQYSPAVPADAPLVFLSRLDRIKGADLAILAARKAGRRLILAGNVALAGPDLDYFKSEIEPHIGRDGIEYVGPVDDEAKNRLLGSAAAMLVPIRWNEPFGIVFAEALACGTPVISSPRGALPEIVAHGTHGFLVEGVDALIDAIRRLPLIDRRACRRRAEESFSINTIVDQYEALYCDFVGVANR